jgi:redox-sensitive bicupin YhaK (pirin superfamily)
MAKPKGAIKHLRKLEFKWDTKDPFIFCVHHQDAYPNGNPFLSPDASLTKDLAVGDDFDQSKDWRMYRGEKYPGFPCHPHRGFETITITQKGYVDHADTSGGGGRYGDGDVHWLTAGKGMMHSEMFPLMNENKVNELDLFQVWLNSPRSKKNIDPTYSMLWKDSISVYETEDNHGRKTRVQQICGDLYDVKGPEVPEDSWASNPDNHVAIWIIEMEAKASWVLPAATAGINRTLYFHRGKGINVDGIDITLSLSIDLYGEHEIILHNEDEPARMLFLQGRPIGEPVVHYGPFVMNTQEEILETFRDYQRTQFGKWPWSSYEMVHNPDKGRFAKHNDGRIETPKS